MKYSKYKKDTVVTDTETFGRLLLIKKESYWTIISKKKLSDSFDTLPRTVRNVGSPEYIRPIWNKLLQDKSWLKDKVFISDLKPKK